ncbi:hypothetical protein BDR05DRAFT_47559 [Suillus weaverae]|nr:hypothetical protein BDR05DRAFT_47559 [Suillus weaverae]
MKKHRHPSSSLGVLPPVMDVAAGAEPTGLLSPAVSQVSTPRADRSTTPSSRSSPSPLFPSESPTSSSLGSVSPAEGRSPSTPSRASRVWDPARGVELFKRGSEEVLARLLKISSREESTRRM